MPSAPLLDLDELIAPIPGDSPAGGPVPFAVREKLEEYRKEINPDDFDPEDPMRPESPQKADWAQAARLARETFGRDLQGLARRRAARRGIDPGARLRRPARRAPLDAADGHGVLGPDPAADRERGRPGGPRRAVLLAGRARPRCTLPEFGAACPHGLGRGGRYSCQHWKQSQSGKDGLAPADIEKAIQSTRASIARRCSTT